MRYLKNQSRFNISKDDKLNVNLHKTRVVKISEVSIPDPEHGDFKLSVFPFENTGEWISLPEGFKIWEKSFNDIVKRIPLQEGANTHFVTIDSKFFTTNDFLRREGVHMDGNFCVDPNFISENVDTLEDEEKDIEYKASWGGASPKPSWAGMKIDREKLRKKMKASWGGAEPKPSWAGAKPVEFIVKEDNSHVQMDWVLPYKIVIPIGQYVSEKKGGILTVSSEVGCQAWSGEFRGEVLSEGAYTKMENQLTDDKKILFEKNKLYFMSSNTPHETLMIEKGNRRSFMRITLNHNYLNESIQ